MLIGRKYEKNLIQDMLDSKKAELGIIWGRRRIGKSTLLKEFVKEKNDFYFEGLEQGSELEQINHFVQQIALQQKTLPVRANTWQEAFDYFGSFIKEGRHYVVIDEFPWMANEKTKLVALFKYYWDRFWSQNPKNKFVLCGSIANFMVKHLVHSKSLHNRKTLEFKLESLPAQEAARFFKNKKNNHEITKFLMIFGGVPKYLEQININQSLSVNLDQLCFQSGAFFIHEFETVFKEQFRVIKVYEAIVETLAKKPSSKELLSKVLKIQSGGGLQTYLDNLEKADFIKKFSTGNKTNRYILWDEWLLFYFLYIKPNLKLIELQKKSGGFEQFTKKNFNIYLGYAFERFCIKNLLCILKALKIPLEEVEDYGPYFRQPKRSLPNIASGTQIDLLIKRKNKTWTICEIKFKDSPIGTEVISQIEKKLKILKPPRNVTVEKVLISASDATQDLIESDYFNQILGLEIFY